MLRPRNRSLSWNRSFIAGQNCVSCRTCTRLGSSPQSYGAPRSANNISAQTPKAGNRLSSGLPISSTLSVARSIVNDLRQPIRLSSTKTEAAAAAWIILDHFKWVGRNPNLCNAGLVRAVGLLIALCCNDAWGGWGYNKILVKNTPRLWKPRFCSWAHEAQLRMQHTI